VRVTGGLDHDSQLLAAIDSLRLDPEERAELISRWPEATSGLLIYGSRARGDYLHTSDFDLLRLTPTPHPTFKRGRVSVSSYSPEQLRSASHTLFGTHLLRDAKIIFDPAGDLARIIATFQPATPSDLLRKVHYYSTILDQPRGEQVEHCPGLVRLARYLLRAAVYAQSMRSGAPCFSVRELAQRFNDPELATLLASDYKLTGPPTIAKLKELTERLHSIVGPPSPNSFGSLAALAVAMWDSDRNLAALAIRAASEDEETLDYSDLPKVLL